jgi:hypothetical protein
MNTFLALILDRLKIASPKGFAALIILVGTANYLLTDPNILEALAAFGIPEWLSKAAQIVSLVYVALTGSRTSNFIGPEPEKKKAF